MYYTTQYNYFFDPFLFAVCPELPLFDPEFPFPFVGTVFLEKLVSFFGWVATVLREFNNNLFSLISMLLLVVLCVGLIT